MSHQGTDSLWAYTWLSAQFRFKKWLKKNHQPSKPLKVWLKQHCHHQKQVALIVTAHLVALSLCHISGGFNHPHSSGVTCPHLLVAPVPGESVSRGISGPRAKVILGLSLVRAKDSQTHLSFNTGAQAGVSGVFLCHPKNTALKLGVFGQTAPCKRGAALARHLYYSFVPMSLYQWQKTQCITPQN